RPASGSSTRSASATVPAGGAVQASAGETSSPSQVCRAGIGSPSPNAGLVSSIAPSGDRPEGLSPASDALVRGAAALLSLAPEEQRPRERGDGRGDRRLVRLAALDRRNGAFRLPLRHPLAHAPREPAEHGVALVDDSHPRPLPRPTPLRPPGASAASGSPGRARRAPPP